MAAIDERVASLENKVASLLARMTSTEGGVRRLNREDEITDTRYAELRHDIRNLQSGGGRAAIIERPLLPEVVIYARPGGNDDNNGLTEATAVQSIHRALELVPPLFEDRRYVIDITGLEEVTLGTSSLASKVSSIGMWNNVDDSGAAYYDPTIVAFEGDISRGALTFRAAFTDLATGVVVTSSDADPVTGLHSVTTTGNFTLNQFKGKQLIGPGFLELGEIQSNTAGPNSVFKTASSYPFTGPLRVCDYGASISLGDTSDQGNPANSSVILCDTYFIGIKFIKPPDVFNFGAGALGIKSGCAVNFTQCEIQGATFRGGGTATFDSCYIYGPEASTFLAGLNYGIYVRGSHVHNIHDGTHGDGSGQTIYQASYFESCPPWGHGGTSQAAHSFSFDNCEFITPQGVAIRYRGPLHARVKDTLINGGTYGIQTDYIGSLQVDNVRGVVGTAGIYQYDGMQIQLINMSDGTGVQSAGGNMIALGSSGLFIGYTLAGALPFYGNATFKGSVNGIEFKTGAADPTAGDGVAANRPAIYVRTGTDQLWLKTGAGNTAWTQIS
jgi:hypothetical protein